MMITLELLRKCHPKRKIQNAERNSKHNIDSNKLIRSILIPK